MQPQPAGAPAPKEPLTVDRIHLGEPEFWGRPLADREEAFRELRRERPLSFHHEVDIGLFPPGDGFWAVTKHADVLHVGTHPKIFCSEKGATTIADIPPEFLEFFGSMINMDNPRHGRLRRLVSMAFTARQLSRVSHDVEHAVSRVLDAVADKGECDFVTEISAPFPISIICDMMGIPESQHGFVFDQTNVLLGGTDPEYVGDPSTLAASLMQAAVALQELMKDLRRQRLERPTDDLTSVLAHAEVDGDRLSEQDMACFFILLVAAGNETTRNAISHGMKALTDHPEQKRIWMSDFDAVAPTAIEEIVRWASPVIFMRRTATQETELRGQKLREGDKLILFYNSANRDEDVFDDPDRFDVRRRPNDHLGFGGGPHFCLGAELARREIRVMFREIFRRFPDLEVVGPPDRLQSAFIHGIKHMPCRFTPARSAT